MADVEENHGFTEDDDPRIPRPLSLADAIPPVRWPLSLLAGVCCGGVAGWAWVSSGPTQLTLTASVASAAWPVFAVARFALERGHRAEHVNKRSREPD